MTARRSPLTIWIEDVPLDAEPRWTAARTSVERTREFRLLRPYRRVRRADPVPADAVFLGPACAVDGGERLWSQDDPWGACECCRPPLKSVAYRPVWDRMRPEAWR